MDNNTIARIRQLDAQLAWLNHTIEAGSHKAAGLTIGVRVGALPAHPDVGDMVLLELGIYGGDTEDVLKLLREFVANSRKRLMLNAKRELDELADGIAELDR